MTDKSSAPPATEVADDDQKPLEFQYGHGRMPFFIKIAWVGFLILATWYIVAHLLTSLGDELGG